ncbi:3-oxoacyl-[acyl-carrier protein] reductase [Sphingobium xenophagum]|uniref:3-oxoacyl-[acyl-carrier protein] reductase n=1 Tax=Sphingobium xenophagum TaxID=121428 RepID=A0ABU1X7Y4_SPHXE|nr:SDR family oxidoreductase [Sphingobium xenophagum]MDR7157237.1 3-oxoacyl-[acyl-carrier protein] reductase [Sphingobium xenophagum]
MTHSDRVAVITGAARGIGQAIAVGLAERGARVIGIDLAVPEETGDLVRKVGGEWLGLTANVSSPDDIAEATSAAFAHFGSVGILINNAGIFPSCSIEDLSYEEWRRVLTVNLDSQFLMTKAFLGSMKQANWGRIVNFTSGSLMFPVEGLAAYKASKMGAIGLTRALAADLGKYGITVNAVSPALTPTPGVMSYGSADKIDQMASMQSIKRVAEARDMVGLVSFLTSNDSEFVTGQTILADGGLTYM